MITMRATVHDRRIEVPAPDGIPDGVEVELTINPNADAGPVPPEEIAHVLAAMQKLEPFEIPDDVAADLDAWEHNVNQHGIDNAKKGIEDVFR
jgi:hypothetical protein